MKFDFNLQFENLMEDNHLQTVLILGHRNPDGDAAGSVLGLAHYIHAVYPEYTVIPHIGENLDKGPVSMAAKDMIFQPFDEIPKIDAPFIMITCDTSTKERIAGGEFFDQAAASMVIDHHVSNEGYGTVNYINPDAEANAENLAHILDWDRYQIAINGKEEYHPNAVDYLYLGLLHDTSCFKRATVSTMKAAMNLQELGADHKDIVKTLHMKTLDDIENQVRLLMHVGTAFGGEVAYVRINHEECRKYGIDYEDIHPISGILRDCPDVEMSFTMYEESKNVWRCSFRSKETIDVNAIVKPFGGGGHKKASGLTISYENPEELFRKILEEVKKQRP